ncbi:helix-turn-helix domain-containing protein [Arthrobacter sp. efr-133-TYG-104]|uniref:helix-turn-helix domain-containing protein n=1 Tax=Arthrobacter sp. efr-133-TYG-104 TaxID=3040324 RepID=UPI0025500645|nr:helix-turn-helix domain-containing protein [Arthrobacter sp. efr-133-TYG-104]
MRLLTIEEVATMLRKSPGQLRWMIHQGSAPASAKIGGRRLFREKDCVAYVNAAFAAPSSTGDK